jgi:hypothetical protein
MKLLNTKRKPLVYSSRASGTIIQNDTECFFYRRIEHGSFIAWNACTRRDFP